MSTITTILGTDTITSSRTVLNANMAALNTDKIETSVIDTDTALAANSDSKIPSQKAVKAYIDALGGLTNLVPTASILPYGGSSAPANFLLCDGTAVSRSTYATLFAITSTTYGVGNGSTTFNLPDLRARLPLGAGAGTWTTTFLNTDANTGTEVITVPSNNSLFDGTVVRLTTTGTLPTGLSLATDYYVIRLSATTIKLASSLANAIAATPVPINLTAQGSGTNTITVTLTTRALGDKGGEELRSSSVAEQASHTHGLSDGAGGYLYNDTLANNSGGSNKPVIMSTSTNNFSAATQAYVETIGGNTPHNLMNPFVVVNYIIKT